MKQAQRIPTTSVATSIGRFQLKRLRGRMFIRVSDLIQLLLAVYRRSGYALGRELRIKPLMFSLLPRCQGLCGSRKKWLHQCFA